MVRIISTSDWRLSSPPLPGEVTTFTCSRGQDGDTSGTRHPAIHRGYEAGHDQVTDEIWTTSTETWPAWAGITEGLVTGPQLTLAESFGELSLPWPACPVPQASWTLAETPSSRPGSDCTPLPTLQHHLTPVQSRAEAGGHPQGEGDSRLPIPAQQGN